MNDLNTIAGEVPAGIVNGSNKTFNVARMPAPGSLAVYVDGVRLGLTTGFTTVSRTITTLVAPTTEIYVDYQY